MIYFKDELEKKAFKENFEKYVSNLKQKKRLSADNRVAISDFVNVAFTGIESWEKKEKRAEVSKYVRACVEVRKGSDPVEEVIPTRVTHMKLESSLQDNLDSIIDQKVEDNSTAEILTNRNEDLLEEMMKCFANIEDVSSAVIKELAAMALGKYHMMDKVVEGVAEGKDILFVKEGE